MLIAVCDDCYEDRQKIRKLIETFQGRKTETEKEKIEVEEYASGAQLCSDMEQLKKYGIIFLDVNIGQEDGLEITRKIKDIYPELPIVLVTALLSYAPEGYRVNASRFLVKDALEDTLPECLEELLCELREKSRKVEFPFVEGSIELPVHKIIYIETDRHKNVFHTTGAVYGLYKKLGEIEKVLAPCGFVRVHQSYLVNMRYVDKISSYLMRLTTGKEISVPKSRYPHVKKEYAAYMAAQKGL